MSDLDAYHIKLIKKGLRAAEAGKFVSHAEMKRLIARKRLAGAHGGSRRTRVRRTTAESVIGILKEQRGMRRFRMRGPSKVAAEFALPTMALNLTRMWQLTPR